MNKKVIASLCIAFAVCLIMTAASHAAAQTEQKAEGSAKSFWQKLFNYPANVTQDSVKTVAETTKRSAKVVTDEVKTLGEVSSGSVSKSGDLVTQPVKGAADTVVKAVEETAKIPTEAAQ